MKMGACFLPNTAVSLIGSQLWKRLPGKAYARRQHVWLAGANEVDSKTFSRAILAKSARIQTVVCIPLLDGVVELGTTDKVQEDLNFIEHIKSFFIDHHLHHPLPPKPALSEHSTSNPTSSSDHIPAVMYTVADPPAANPNQDDMDEDEDEEDDEEEEEEEAESDSEDETGRNTHPTSTPDASGMVAATAGEPSELMQLEMPEDIRVGSPNDGSNNLDSDFHLLAVSQPGNQSGRSDSYRAESTRRWGPIQDPLGSLQVQLPASVLPPLEDLTQEDTHYSQTVSNILQNQSIRWADSPSIGYIIYSTQSAFAKWSTRADHHLPAAVVDGTSQWLLKYILFTVPYLHAKNHDDNSPQTRDAAARLRGKGTPQDELSANHVLAERRRREKLNERFIILRSLVPFVTKMDKASILGDTIEYVKQLRRKIQDLEARNRQMEAEQQRPRTTEVQVQRTLSSSSTKEQQRSGVTVMVGPDKRKVRIVEGSGMMTRAAKAVEVEASTSVQVSIIESDALLELECPHREGLLLDVMLMLRELRIEVIGAQSSINNGVFVAELRGKVKIDNANGKRVSIVEVKRALNQIIPHTTD